MQVPSGDADRQHWHNRGGKRYKGGSEMREYLLLKVISRRYKNVPQVVKMNANNSLPTIFIDAGITNTFYPFNSHSLMTLIHFVILSFSVIFIDSCIHFDT